jgi:hypothetical protein
VDQQNSNTLERFVRVMARFSIAGMVAHLSGNVDKGFGPELVLRMLHEESLPADLAQTVQSRNLLRAFGRGQFDLFWGIAIKEAALVLPPENQVDAITHFTAARAWRQLMY